MTNVSNQAPDADEQFTVVLLKPDYVADNFGQDIAVLHIDAPDVESAETRAQEQYRDAYCKNSDEDIEDNPAEDYHVLAVFKGHLHNIQSQ